MFTKKHYDRVALVIANITDQEIRAKLTADFAKIFTDDNPKFDKLKWYNATKPQLEQE